MQAAAMIGWSWKFTNHKHQQSGFKFLNVNFPIGDAQEPAAAQS
jgi:hypothetical protein